MIAMFDSGLGGLSIWRVLIKALPNWPITYLADQAYCPYGTRSQAEICRRSLKIGHWFVRQGASLLVVACNTATSAAVDNLRHELSIPVVGIEPAIKPAAAASRTGRIAVLATPLMLESARFCALIARHAAGVEVLSRPGIGWVEQVEAGDLRSPLTCQIVATTIVPLLGQQIDQIVLGCTHYPFLAPLIDEFTGGEAITLNDPAHAIARRVFELLNRQAIPGVMPYRFITTSLNSDNMAQHLPLLIKQRYPVESLLLPEHA